MVASPANRKDLASTLTVVKHNISVSKTVNFFTQKSPSLHNTSPQLFKSLISLSSSYMGYHKRSHSCSHSRSHSRSRDCPHHRSRSHSRGSKKSRSDHSRSHSRGRSHSRDRSYRSRSYNSSRSRSNPRHDRHHSPTPKKSTGPYSAPTEPGCCRTCNRNCAFRKTSSRNKEHPNWPYWKCLSCKGQNSFNGWIYERPLPDDAPAPSFLGNHTKHPYCTQSTHTPPQITQVIHQ